MIAYKGFRPGMICIGYQFQMGLNVTEKANCRQNGFHCAEDPLDCLSYYSDVDHSEYYIVNAGGDIDEDEVDSKISCTELTVLKRLTKEELFLHGLAFMADHPKRKWNDLDAALERLRHPHHSGMVRKTGDRKAATRPTANGNNEPIAPIMPVTKQTISRITMAPQAISRPIRMERLQEATTSREIASKSAD